MKALHLIALILLIVGGLNWLALGVFNWELGEKLLGGQDQVVSKAIYVLIGLAAIVELAMHKKTCRLCGGSEAPTTPVVGGM